MAKKQSDGASVSETGPATMPSVSIRPKGDDAHGLELVWSGNDEHCAIVKQWGSLLFEVGSDEADSVIAVLTAWTKYARGQREPDKKYEYGSDAEDTNA